MLTLNSPLLVMCWNFLVSETPAGSLELWAGARGYFWYWRDKPARLVSLRGIGQAPGDLMAGAWTFGDQDDAFAHLMRVSGQAFAGRCALEAPASC